MRVPFLLALLVCAACGGDAPSFTTSRVARDLLIGAPTWEVRRAPAGERPVVEVLTPSLATITDSADQLALVMPPESDVRFTVREEDGPCWLRADCGVHFTVARRLERAREPFVVRFDVQVNGAHAARVQVPVHSRTKEEVHDVSRPQNEWHALDAVPLAPGDEVLLQVSLAQPRTPALEKLPRFRSGWGNLRLERRRAVERTTASPERPNIVFVVMDTQRADRSCAYSYERSTTPRLTELAARGVTFEAAYSAATWTWPSTASLLTGLAPAAHGVVTQRTGFLAHELETLAEALQDKGFTTGGFSGNPIVTAPRNFDQGFEHFEATAESCKGDRVVPAALEWLDAHRGSRFFLYLHLQDPHMPHAPRPQDLAALTGRAENAFPPMHMQERAFEIQRDPRPGADGRARAAAYVTPEMEAWYQDVYDACVLGGDYWLGVVLDQLDEWGLTENTVIVYTSDHGEELLEHANLTHGHEVWQELVRVPLVLAGPGLPRGARVATPVTNRDLGPTLARLGGAELAAARDAQFLLDVDALEARPVFFETSEGWLQGHDDVHLLGVRRGPWVLHWAPAGRPWGAARDADPGEGLVRLFHLPSDPGEETDRAASEPALVHELRSLLATELARQSARAPDGTERAGAGTLEQLQAIGYADGGDEDE